MYSIKIYVWNTGVCANSVYIKNLKRIPTVDLMSCWREPNGGVRRTRVSRWVIMFRIDFPKVGLSVFARIPAVGSGGEESNLKTIEWDIRSTFDQKQADCLGKTLIEQLRHTNGSGYRPVGAAFDIKIRYLMMTHNCRHIRRYNNDNNNNYYYFNFVPRTHVTETMVCALYADRSIRLQ